MSTSGGKKAVIAALLANAAIAVAKFVGFAITGASSMLAEAVHSCADAGNQALLLYGGKRATTPADETHPFGYGAVRYFWAFVVALVLFSLGSLFALYEGVSKLRDPHELVSPAVAIGILLVAIVAECFSFRTAIVESRHVKGEESWISFIRHTRNPELPVVLLEDLGALLGLVLALLGVCLSAATGDPVYDALGTLAIAALLGVIAIVLAAEMKSLLIGEAATPAQVRAINAAVDGSPEVTRSIHLRTLHLGPDRLLVAAKLQLRAATTTEAADAIDAVEARIRAAVPMECTIYLEPDSYDATPAAP